MLTYVTLAMILNAFFGPTIVWEVSGKIRDGNIVTEFQRPWDYQASVFFRLLGMVYSRIITVILPIAVITFLFFPIDVPDDAATWAIFALSVSFGLVINFCLQFFIGLLSFIFVEVWGFEIVLGLMISFLAGQLIPLWMFPSLLQKISYYLPFRGMYDIPLSIFTGRTGAAEYVELLTFQFGWLCILLIVLRLMLRYFERVLITAGG